MARGRWLLLLCCSCAGPPLVNPELLEGDGRALGVAVELPAPAPTYPEVARKAWQPAVMPAGQEARQGRWEDVLQAGYEPGMVLPHPSGDELGSGDDAVTYLPRYAARLARWEDGAGPGRTTFGDIAQSLRGVRRDAVRSRAALAEITASPSERMRAIAPALGELLAAPAVYGDAWTPSRTAEDGILEGRAFELRSAPARPGPWRELAEPRPVYQAMALVYADIESIVRSDLDFARRVRDPGSRKLDAYVIEGSYVRGQTPRPFVYWRSFHLENVGFPFGRIAYVVESVRRVSEEGFVVWENYCACEPVGELGNFNWMAARDTFVPVRDSAGRFVGTLVASCVTFDLAGVPELATHRRETIRARLGNLKREAELLYDRR